MNDATHSAGFQTGPARHAVPPPGGIAVLVDGENVSPKALASELRKVFRDTDVAVRRVYGNVAQLGQWSSEPGFRLFHTAQGKNSADMQIAIDAVEISHGGGIGTFVLATSDGDFCALAHHLRERHFRVIGLGEAKAPRSFRQACGQFVEIPGCPEKTDQTQTKPPAKTPANDPDAKIKAYIKANTVGNGMPIASLNGPLYRQGIHISKMPEQTWRAYLEARPNLYSCDPKGPNARVRWIGG